MEVLQRVSTRNLAKVGFFLNILDIVSDLCYIVSRNYKTPQLKFLSQLSVFVNVFGLFLFLAFGYLFYSFINIVVFGVKKFNWDYLKAEVRGTLNLYHAFVFKSSLFVRLNKNKALYRTSLLLHITFESTPQVLIQGFNNYYLGLWLQPLSVLSFGVSFSMIVLAVVVAIKTDKHLL